MTEQRVAVLVVDDQPNWRSLFSDLLEDEYEITSVSSYDEAAKALDREPPFHVAVVDIRLDDRDQGDQGNEDGLRLIEKLNEREDHTNTIVVTGYPTVRTVRKALQDLDVFDYIEKYPANDSGFDSANFRKTVRRAADATVYRRSRKVYVTACFEGVPQNEPLKTGRHYILVLEFQDAPEVDALEVQLPSGKRLTLMVDINVLNMKVQPAKTIPWEIPAKDSPSPLRIKLIPKISGRDTIFIDLQLDEDWVGSIEKEVSILQETGECD